MNHSFMASVSAGLADRGIATLRYQFPFMERGSKRPDSPRVARTAVRAAIAMAASLMPDTPLFAGGKSFGGRMTSQAQAESALPQVRGLIFLGFPLHPAKEPSRERAEHLQQISCSMLFLQGTHDELAMCARAAGARISKCSIQCWMRSSNGSPRTRFSCAVISKVPTRVRDRLRQPRRESPYRHRRPICGSTARG